MDEGHEGEGDQGADQAQQDDQRQEFDVGCRSGLWVNHWSTPPIFSSIRPYDSQLFLDGLELFLDGEGGRGSYRSRQAAGVSSSAEDDPPTSRLARMLARAPMMPTPMNMMNIAVIRPPVVTG